MSQSQDTLRPQFELRVNGIADPRIRFRMSHDEPDDFDLLVLCRAGFCPSPISPAALVEPQTRCAVQLVEQRI